MRWVSYSIDFMAADLMFCTSGEMHAFSGWRIAFEMNLKLREYKKAHAISDGCLKDRESVGEFVNYQLVLDFESKPPLISIGPSHLILSISC